MKATRTETVDVIAYLVRFSNGETATISAEQFEAEFSVEGPRPIQAIQPEEAPLIAFLKHKVQAEPQPEPTRVIMPRPPNTAAPDEPEDRSGVVCTQCGQTYKRGTGSKTGLLCANCTPVKCPTCHRHMTLAQAKAHEPCQGV